MQTPVMGWVDPDLQKNANSPYFLGRWYPAEQPETFFKPVELKPAYAELYFAPATRLPLYQTVFHVLDLGHPKKGAQLMHNPE